MLLNNLCEYINDKEKNQNRNEVLIKVKQQMEEKHKISTNKINTKPNQGYDDNILTQRDKANNLKGIEYTGFRQNTPNIRFIPDSEKKMRHLKDTNHLVTKH